MNVTPLPLGCTRFIRAVACLAAAICAFGAAADPADANDPRVQALATTLGNNPAAIHQYVRDNIGIEIYTGSLRGARGVLASKAGNALDRASLTIALLRAANPAIEARYVQGTLTTTDASTLVTRMFSDPSRILGCDNPAPGLNPANLVPEMQGHTWVEYRVGASGAYTALDTAFAGASVNQTFTTANQTFASIPANQRHTTRVRLDVETFTQAAAAFGLGLGTTTVIDRSFDSADLVDKPITVSHFVNAFSPPALAIGATQNTYSPYLTVGDSRSSIASYDVIRGSDYSEIITNFPLGNILVTGVFVNIDIVDPSGQVQTYRRPMFDRVGYVTRALGGSVSVDPASFTRPALGDLDLMTISVSPSRQALDDFSARKTRLQALQSQLATLAPQVQALPPPGLRDATQQAMARNAVNLNRYALIATQEIALATFLGAADRQMDDQSLRTLVKAYVASPRVTISQSKIKSNAFALSLDIRKNDLRTLPLPGISYANSRDFERVRGLGESVLEGDILSQLTGDPNRSISSVFSGLTDSSRYLPIGKSNLDAANDLNLSPEVRLRIQDAVGAGRVVLAPMDVVNVQGTPVTAWLETDPNTGYTISTMEDGSHGAFVEYLFLLAGVEISYFEDAQAQFIGRVSAIGVFGVAFMSAVLESVANADGFGDIAKRVTDNIRTIVKIRLSQIKAELALAGFATLKASGGAGIVVSLVSGLLDGLTDITKALVGEGGDPPLPSHLFSSAVPPLPAPQPPGATAGLTLSASLDPRFTVPFLGAEFPSVYLVRAVNTGPAADFFRFDSTGSGPNLYVTDVRYVWPVVRIAPGATFEFHVCVAPDRVVPAVGAASYLQFSGTSTTTPSVTATFTGSFVTPATTALSMRILPNPQVALPGAVLAQTLTVESRGNQSTNVTLAAQSSPGLTVTGVPANVTLSAGESQSFPFTATVASTVSAGTDLSTLVTADFGAAFPVRTALTVSVTSAVTQCIGPASIAAARITRTNLASVLGAMTNDVDQLAAQPGSTTLRQQVLAELDNTISQLTAPFMTPLVPGFTAVRATLAAASTASVGAALASLDSQFCALRTALVAAYSNAFRVYLSPAIATSLPNLSTRVNVNVYNDTPDPRAMNLSITGLPSGVTATFNTTRVIVPANYRTNFYLPELYVTFNGGAVAQAFEYQIIVTPEDDPASVKTTIGQLTVRPEIVRIVDVTMSPTYGSAGTSFTPTARLLSAVNDTRSVFVRYVVKNRNGAIAYQSNTPTVNFTPGDNVQTVALQTFSTTGYSDGPYTVEVTAYDPAFDAIPGATATATLFVGQPFAAGLTVTPSLIAPGTSTVNVALNLDRSLVAQQSLKLRSTLGLPAGPLSFAQNGNYLYVCQNTAVTIVNVSNPDAPVTAGTFASALLTNGAPSGYESVDCTAYNGRLIVGYDKRLPERSGSRTLAIFDISGANATSPVLVTPTPIDTGKKFGNGLRFVGSDGYMSTALFVYNPYSNFIFDQRGNVLKFDFSTPNAPTFTGNLYPAGAGNPPENQADTGGPHFIKGVTPNTSNRALVATTSGTGDFFNGVGRLLTIDTSQLATNCPGLTNPCIISTLDIPQARLLIGVASQGTAAVATGDTQGYYDLNSGYTGNLTLSAINLANPSAPTLSSTLVTPLVHNETYACNQAERKGFSSLQALTNNYYAIGAYNPASCTWVLVLIDANDQAHLRFIPYDVPDSIREFVLNGNLLYAVTASSVLVFDYSGIVGPSVTANVVVPKGTGVALVPGSFNLAPSSIASTATTDTFTWLQPTVAPINWQATVSNMQPGSGRPVANGGSVAFTLPSLGSGTLLLAPAVVTANHIIAVSASTPLNVAIGAPATYVITLTNPSTTLPVTYTLSTQGIPTSWVKTLAPTVTVSANSSTTTPLVVQSNVGQSGGNIDFRVVATAGTASDAAVATLANYYNPDLGPDPSATIVDSMYSVTPNPASGPKGSTTTITVRVSNTGNFTQTFYLGSDNLPNGWSTTIQPASAIVPPGEFYDFKVAVAIASPPSAVVGANTFILNLDASNQARRVLSPVVNVIDAGVGVSVSPNSGTASTPFVATITNFASTSDTFDLALTGPLGPTITPSTSAVTLAAGASTTVNLSVGNPAAFARPGNSSFTVNATSRANAIAFGRSSATVVIPASTAVSVVGQPASSTVSSTPATRTVNVIVQNLGNVEDRYSLTITGSTGPVTAKLIDASGAGVASIGSITVPAFSSAAIRATATITGSGLATVTVRATSLTTGTQASTTLTFNPAPVCSFDIDGDGIARPLTDGLMIIRYMLGLSGTPLIQGAFNPEGAFANISDINTRLNLLRGNNWLDIDDNGTSLAESDGILLLRAMFGLTGTAVTHGALGEAPRNREDWAAIKVYLNTTCNMNLP